MLGFALKKTNLVRGSDRPVGLDVTASRAVALGWEQGASFPIMLDPTGTNELPLLLRMDTKPVEIGTTAKSLVKKLPHVLCGNFLGSVGTSREWVGSRTRFTTETALGTIFEYISKMLAVEAGTVLLSLPAYLKRSQTQTIVDAATRSGLPVVTGVIAPLAVAARRAGWLLGDSGNRTRDVLTMRPEVASGVVIVDVDDYALTASYITIDVNAVQFHGASVVTRGAERLWRDKLLDAIADKCIRKCRRDPRDSATAEQSLWEQIIDGLNHARAGRTLTLNIRSEHWYQDLTISPDELDDWCRPLAELCANAVREVVEQANAPWPPRAVWLSDEASHLPGFATSLHLLGDGHGGLEVQSLPPYAAAEGAVVLTHRLTPGLHDRVLRGPWGPTRVSGELGRHSG